MQFIRLTWMIGPSPTHEQIAHCVEAFIGACSQEHLSVLEATIELVEKDDV